MDGAVQLKLVDVTGKIIYSCEEQIKNNEQILTINTSLFDKGIYFLYIENKNNFVMKKIIVQH